MKFSFIFFLIITFIPCLNVESLLAKLNSDSLLTTDKDTIKTFNIGDIKIIDNKGGNIIPTLNYSKIQVNDKLVRSGLNSFNLKFGSGENEKFIPVDYMPGELILTMETWEQINSDSLNKFSLSFNYTTYHNKVQTTANYYVGLSREKLQQRYLILNIYDFKDKKYKHWYQWHTDKSFLAELEHPNSGLYIRRR